MKKAKKKKCRHFLKDRERWTSLQNFSRCFACGQWFKIVWYRCKDPRGNK